MSHCSAEILVSVRCRNQILRGKSWGVDIYALISYRLPQITLYFYCMPQYGNPTIFCFSAVLYKLILYFPKTRQNWIWGQSGLMHEYCNIKLLNGVAHQRRLRDKGFKKLVHTKTGEQTDSVSSFCTDSLSQIL